MPMYIKVAAFPAPLAGRYSLRQEHPERIIINFEVGEDGGPASPPRYKVWSAKTLSPEQINQIHALLASGAAHDELPDGTVFAVLRHLG